MIPPFSVIKLVKRFFSLYGVHVPRSRANCLPCRVSISTKKSLKNGCFVNYEGCSWSAV